MGHRMSDTEVEGAKDHLDGQGDKLVATDEFRGGPSRLRSVLVVMPLVAGLVVVAGIGARMLLADIPDPEPEATVADVTCWDGTTKAAEDCTSPTGRAGLRWVFPSFKPDLLGCRNVLLEHPEFKRPTMFECDGAVPTGRVTITYSELSAVPAGRAYLEKEYGVAPEEIDDGRLLWTDSGSHRRHLRGGRDVRRGAVRRRGAGPLGAGARRRAGLADPVPSRGPHHRPAVTA
jgi:hypothetical protein